jgi:5-methylcytosine-specific restriction endonuclease McrA
MPIRPERKKLYPENWERISFLTRERAAWKCELCGAANGLAHPMTRSIVVLTVHHINGDPTDNRRLNLIALCQRCHNRLDQPFRHPRKAKGGLI